MSKSLALDPRTPHVRLELSRTINFIGVIDLTIDERAGVIVQDIYTLLQELRSRLDELAL